MKMVDLSYAFIGSTLVRHFRFLVCSEAVWNELFVPAASAFMDLNSLGGILPRTPLTNR